MGKETQPTRSCEAPEHTEGCNGYGNTKDHFTPKGVAKLLGWSHKRLDNPMNIQWLSTACHRAKDSTTDKRVEILLDQLNGIERTLEEYMLFFRPPQIEKEQEPKKEVL